MERAFFPGDYPKNMTAATAPLSDGAHSCKARMELENLPRPVIDNFLRLYRQVEQGQTGIITEEQISPVPRLDTYEEISADERYRELGRKALPQLVVCKLNGGLGTGMGLERAKSLLRVRSELTFNHIIAEQLLYYREVTGVQVPLLHMTSFSTQSDIEHFMEGYPQLKIPGLPSSFLQHKHPKIYADTLLPSTEADESLNWNPPGHGDLYAALLSTGVLDQLIAAGKRYIFVSNSDNLGATPDLAILGYLAANQVPFMLEAAVRTLADSKGGHLALRKADQHLILREGAQAPAGPDGSPSVEFQNVERYGYFNSNSEWGDLIAWRDTAKAHGGVIPLSLIRNEKTVNPRDAKSRKVYQLETAMGAAIEVFDGARGVCIPRTRFSPVKATVDLLGVRSDAYQLREDKTLALHPERLKMGPPVISLPGKFYKMIDDFDARFGTVPSLIKAKELKVDGNFFFGSPLAVEGSVTIVDQRTAAKNQPIAIDSSVTVLSNEVYAVTDEGVKRTKL